MGIKFANYIRMQLTEDITAVETAIDVDDASGLPALGGSDYIYLTIFKQSDQSKEIVKCTGITSNTLTVTRGQDGTTAQAFSIGDSVEPWLNKLALEDVLGSAGGGILPEDVVEIDHTDSPYAIVAGDVGKLIRVTSSTTSEVTVTIDPTLLTTNTQISLENESSYRGLLEVDDTGTDTINGNRTNLPFWAGDGLLSIVGKSSTQVNTVAGY